MKKTADIIKTFREVNSLTCEELDELMRFHKGTCRSIEEHGIVPSGDVLLKILAELKVELKYNHNNNC